MICGECKFTDGMCYTSNPPKRKCTITSEYHCYHDECNCEAFRLAKEQEQKQVLDILNTPPTLIADNAAINSCFSEDFGKPLQDAFENVAIYSTACVICREPIAVNFLGGGPRVCEDCKKAVLFIRNRFKQEIETDI